MTLREAAKGVVTAYGGAYHIGFENPEIGEDQTMFSADNLKDIEMLWKDFCEENGFRKNSVTYVERV